MLRFWERGVFKYYIVILQILKFKQVLIQIVDSFMCFWWEDEGKYNKQKVFFFWNVFFRMVLEVVVVERKGGYNQFCDFWAVGIIVIEFVEFQSFMFDLYSMRLVCYS